MTRRSVSRRGLIGGGAAAAVGAGAIGVGAFALPDSGPDTSAAWPQRTYPFRGAHQAGITTPAQDRLHFAAFDVTTDSRAQLVDLLKQWTLAAERMTRGGAAGTEIGRAHV